ncbi:MAG: hypothetical protein ABR899_07435 [Candidatus Krumholzibacteriaceae bacterium]
MRNLFLVWAVLSIASCGVPGRVSRGSDGPVPGGFGENGALEETIEDPDLAREDFDVRERLADNPIDPSRAGIETLASIPGFPEELARSIVAAARERRVEGGWLARLTPEEREELYLYRDYLVLPAPHPFHMSCRLTENRFSTGGEGVKDGYVSVNAGGWKALWRGKVSETGGGSACYLSGSLFADALRLHGGTFVPDYALGLVFGGSSQVSVLSSAYPFHSPRGIAGSTSFYSPAVLGAGAELRFRRFRGAAFAGRPRVYRSDHFEEDGGGVFGGRVELQEGNAVFGASGSSDASGSGRSICAIDARLAADRTKLGFELGSRGAGEPAILSGFSCGLGRSHAGLFLYSVPAGLRGTFGEIDGRTPGASNSAHGVTAAIEGEIVPRLKARAAIDRYSRADGLDERERRSVRVECERKWKRFMLRLTWVSTDDGHRDVVPYPGSLTGERSESSSLGVVSGIRIARQASLGFTLREVRDGDGLGYLVQPTARTSLFGERLKASVSLARYRAVKGAAVCYFYEPSLKGSYPWRVASRDTERAVFLIVLIINRLDVSFHAALDRERPPEISLQGALAL